MPLGTRPLGINNIAAGQPFTRLIYTYSASGLVHSVADVGMIMYFNFDESTGAIANDTSGYQNNGIVTNAAGWSSIVAPLRIPDPHSYAFNGSTDSVDVMTMNGLQNGMPFAVSLWFNAATINKRQVLVHGGRGAESLYFDIEIGADNILKFTIGTGQ
jgi:hypothetical protein